MPLAITQPPFQLHGSSQVSKASVVAAAAAAAGTIKGIYVLTR